MRRPCQAAKLTDGAHLGRAAIDVEERLRIGEIGLEHAVHMHRQTEPHEKFGEQIRPLRDAKAAWNDQASRIVASPMTAVDEIPDFLVGVAYRLRLRAAFLARDELVDRAAAAERE